MSAVTIALGQESLLSHIARPSPGRPGWTMPPAPARPVSSAISISRVRLRFGRYFVDDKIPHFSAIEIEREGPFR